MSLFAEVVGSAGIISLLYFCLILSDAEKTPEYAVALIRCFPLGATLVLSMSLGNSMVEGHWDKDYVLMFLFLKDVGRWPFRILTGLGYIFVELGMASILALAIRKLIRR